ncbi:XdhC family protein [Cohnella sp.]|uniref:XdhC family protein n=1 Tax=Cohnella sp. TaxID=1883426 RepID=UPI003564F1A9
MGDWVDILDALSHTGRKLLATIVRVDGSAYRKEGAMMLLTENRKRYGILSGGCLEDDLAERAPGVWDEGVSQTVAYDLRSEDDLSWGQGIGCNGSVHVLMEPLNGKMTAHLRRLKRELEEGTDVLHVKRLSEQGGVADYLFLAGDKRWFGSWRGPVPKNPVQLLASNRKAVWIGAPGENLFVQRFEPQPRLLVFGAGPDAKPLVRIAAGAGFRVAVSDWRPALCSRDHFPEADELIVDSPDRVAAAYRFSERDSVISMTHHFQKDRQIFEALRSKPLRYFGILGSKDRARRLAGDPIPNGLHCPAGLPIGAEGPEEIAISLVADLIKAARLRRVEDDLGDLLGGRAEPQNGTAKAVPAGRG